MRPLSDKYVSVNVAVNVRILLVPSKFGQHGRHENFIGVRVIRNWMVDFTLKYF